MACQTAYQGSRSESRDTEDTEDTEKRKKSRLARTTTYENYLKATRVEVGLLLNFGPTTDVKRRV